MRAFSFQNNRCSVFIFIPSRHKDANVQMLQIRLASNSQLEKQFSLSGTQLPDLTGSHIFSSPWSLLLSYSYVFQFLPFLDDFFVFPLRLPSSSVFFQCYSAHPSIRVVELPSSFHPPFSITPSLPVAPLSVLSVLLVLLLPPFTLLLSPSLLCDTSLSPPPPVSISPSLFFPISV